MFCFCCGKDLEVSESPWAFNRGLHRRKMRRWCIRCTLGHCMTYIRTHKGQRKPECAKLLTTRATSLS